MKQKGFSLIEMLLVLVIMSILMTGGISVFKAQRESALYRTSQAKLQQIKQHLLSFVQIHGYLPCPVVMEDSNPFRSSGKESRQANGACQVGQGGVPFVTLGLSALAAQDGFNGPFNQIRYAIHSDSLIETKVCDAISAGSYFCAVTPFQFNAETPPTANQLSSGGHQLCRVHQADCPADQLAMEQAVGVLVAFNRNAAEQTQVCDTLVGAEHENCDGDLNWVAGPRSNHAQSFLDDQLLAISGYEIKQVWLNSRSHF